MSIYTEETIKNSVGRWKLVGTQKTKKKKKKHFFFFNFKGKCKLSKKAKNV